LKKGTVAVVVTPLRPFGKVEVDGKVYEATTENEWVDAGEQVVVVGEEGATLQVEKK
jgi:membrane-bound serine protease (ClpP class)